MTFYSEAAMAPRVLTRKVTSPKHPAGVISLQPTDQWQGNDANWSTFAIDVGTPQQQYRLLPSTSSSQTWIPDPPQACNLGESVPDCAFRRGIDSKNVSLEQSTSWTDQGMYELSNGHGTLGDVGNGTLGTDNITLNQAIPTEAGVSRQLLTAYVNSPVWMGLLGLGDDAGKLPNINVSAAGILSNLRASGQVGSRSYGYTAGAHYLTTPSFASLTLGGYDKEQIHGSSIEFDIDPGNKTLEVPLRQIIASTTLQNSQASLQPKNGTIIVRIDSSTSYLWLPSDMCDAFTKAFGLIERTDSGFFLVNATTQKQFMRMNPIITFTIGHGATNSDSLSFRFPYSAFNQYVGAPYYGFNVSYFPIRRAANESQYVLGRSFLQEAYLVVDWERNKFNLSQASHSNGGGDLIPIAGMEESEHRLSGGELAAIIISCLVVAIAVFAAWLWQSYQHQPLEPPNEFKEEGESYCQKLELNFVQEALDRKARLDSKASELDPDNGLLELAGRSWEQELMSTQILEMEGDGALRELGAESVSRPLESVQDESKATKDRASVHELEA